MEVIQFLERSHYDLLAQGFLGGDLGSFGDLGLSETGWNTGFDGGGYCHKPSSIWGVLLSASAAEDRSGNDPTSGWAGELRFVGDHGEYYGWNPVVIFYRLDRVPAEWRGPYQFPPWEDGGKFWSTIETPDVPPDVRMILSKILNLGQSLTGQGGDFFRVEGVNPSTDWKIAEEVLHEDIGVEEDTPVVFDDEDEEE